MEWLVTGSVILVIVLHVAFLVLEMFLWTTPLGMKIYGLSLTEAKMTRVLAQNQGLYNGFLARIFFVQALPASLSALLVYLEFVA
jgi:putative membrane protein